MNENCIQCFIIFIPLHVSLADTKHKSFFAISQQATRQMLSEDVPTVAGLKNLENVIIFNGKAIRTLKQLVVSVVAEPRW